MYGPLSGFGTYPFERNNGALANINHNGQERDVPSTCLRGWLLESGIARIVNTPAPDATEAEKEALRALMADKSAVQGTLMLDEARGNAANKKIRLPTPFENGHVVDLSRYLAYQPLLRYVQEHHPEYRLVDAAYMLGEDPCLPARSTSYRVYTHAIYTGFKFCSLLYTRTRRDQFALVSPAVGNPDGPRELCRLRLFLSVKLRVPHLDRPLQLTLGLVEFLEPAGGQYPWQYRSIDLGLRIYRKRYQAPVFIPLENMKASTIVTEIETRSDGICLVSTSCEKDGEEPEYWLNSDELPGQNQDDGDEDEGF
ncbi:hypothetical protein HD553DRAFT_343010 [Filobasidium floriforme]|uniref:uncharacterized protein n=1 Tax=Filobasidium floriforme TaxID=5210 RepID=UPI001E8DEBF9|nr:uncharacterized protein HD553DRAFT_343010 [Filobasidium floriforme]KAH8083027.1 hypothetical protein HD553DRAFT_343010 [Filobasidium floriforme]